MQRKIVTDARIECRICGEPFWIREEEVQRSVYRVPDHKDENGVRCWGSRHIGKVLWRRMVEDAA